MIVTKNSRKYPEKGSDPFSPFSLMLTATAVYTLAVSMGVAATTSMMVLGGFILLATTIIAAKLPENT